MWQGMGKLYGTYKIEYAGERMKGLLSKTKILLTVIQAENL